MLLVSRNLYCHRIILSVQYEDTDIQDEIPLNSTSLLSISPPSFKDLLKIPHFENIQWIFTLSVVGFSSYPLMSLGVNLFQLLPILVKPLDRLQLSEASTPETILALK